MSIFASETTSDPIPVPFDPPHTVTVRKLTARECDAAAQAHRNNLAGGNPRLWPATFRRALEFGATDPEVLKAIADPLTGYDRYALVRAGLIAWSYPRSVKPVAATPAITGKPGSAIEAVDAIADLDDEAVDFIATEVLRRTKPALFMTAGEAEADRKNGSAVSTEV